MSWADMCEDEPEEQEVLKESPKTLPESQKIETQVESQQIKVREIFPNKVQKKNAQSEQAEKAELDEASKNFKDFLKQAMPGFGVETPLKSEKTAPASVWKQAPKAVFEAPKDPRERDLSGIAEGYYILCIGCKREFYFPDYSVVYFHENGWPEPKRCKFCKEKQKQEKAAKAAKPRPKYYKDEN